MLSQSLLCSCLPLVRGSRVCERGIFGFEVLGCGLGWQNMGSGVVEGDWSSIVHYALGQR